MTWTFTKPLFLVLLLTSACAPLETTNRTLSRRNESNELETNEVKNPGTETSIRSSESTETLVNQPEANASTTEVVQRQFWNSQDFKKRIMASYVSESDIEPSLDPEEREAFLLAMEFITAEDLISAEKVLRDAAGASASAAIDYTLATVLYQQERLRDAAANFKVAVGKYPKYRRAWNNLAEIHYRSGDFGEAASAFTKVIELGGGDAVMYGLLGDSHHKSKNPIAAEFAFRMAIMHDPSTVDWKIGLAQSYFAQDRFTEAASLFDRLIALKPDQPELWLAQGEAYARLNMPMKAAENLEIADKLGGSTAGSLSTLGDIYANEELFDVAVAYYKRAMEMAPNGSPDGFIRPAKFMSAKGATQEASELIDSIESVFGNRLQTDKLLGLKKLRARLAFDSGADKEEVRALEEVLALDPVDGEALILLGRFHARNDSPEQAILYFERAAVLPEFEADAKLRHAQLLVSQGQYKTALPLIRSSQELKPRQAVEDFLRQVEGNARTQL